MRELVGLCKECGKKIFCEGGFFDGHIKDGKLLCHICSEKEE